MMSVLFHYTLKTILLENFLLDIVYGYFFRKFYKQRYLNPKQKRSALPSGGHWEGVRLNPGLKPSAYPGLQTPGCTFGLPGATTLIPPSGEL